MEDYGRWLAQKGERGDPPVCTNSALASLLFPAKDCPETEGLPFQITFLYSGIVKCTDPEASLLHTSRHDTMEHPS